METTKLDFGGDYEVVFDGKPLPGMPYASACHLYELLGRVAPARSLALIDSVSVMRSRNLPISVKTPA